VTKLAADDRVPVLARYASASMVLDGQAITGASLEAVKGDMHLTRLRGRLPATPTEVALGSKTLAQLGLSIGDTTEAIPAGGGDPVPLTVVGTAVLPATDEVSIDTGAVVTGEGLARFGQGDVSENPVLGFPHGANVASTEAALARDYGLDFNLFTEPKPQGSVANLAEPRDIAVALAGFLAMLAVVGMEHVLLVSTRRRGRDLGMLRAMGLLGRQAERAVVVEALALTVAGLVVGIPAGVIVGRAVWRSLVANLGAVADPQWPWLLFALVIPAAALLAAVLSWWPARRVRNVSPAAALRVE
jgi:ABC-type antimicrobial peptide transport system permease subunit